MIEGQSEFCTEERKLRRNYSRSVDYLLEHLLGEQC